MAHEHAQMSARVALLERQLRTLKGVAVAAVVIAIALTVMPRPQAQQVTDVLRVRRLIVEDGNRQPRIVLGYLDGEESARRIGLRINDPAGVERLGAAVMDSGAMVLGLDAPPGTGNDANRERINLVADEKGGAHIRFLDRRTNVVSRMYLDDQNRVWMQFSDFTQKPAVIRRYGLTGEEAITPKP